MAEAEIHIVPYDASWPRRFEEERKILVQAIGHYAAGTIEHVGSTAVPGLAAKPVIEYCYFPYRPDVEHWFCKPSPQFRTHHLHLVPVGSRLWIERMAFRDYLRTHPDVAAHYASLKRELAERYRFDREAYTDAKEPFIRRTVERAMGDRAR